jgi:hypothetical protein
MTRHGVSLASAAALTSLLCGAEAADLPTPAPSPASPPSCFASFADYFFASAQECPLTWNGITLYGILDYGAGYQTHGVPFTGVYPNGVEELISKNRQRSPLRSDSEWARSILCRRQRERDDRRRLVTRVQSAKRF